MEKQTLPEHSPLHSVQTQGWNGDSQGVNPQAVTQRVTVTRLAQKQWPQRLHPAQAHQWQNLCILSSQDPWGLPEKVTCSKGGAKSPAEAQRDKER